MAEIVRFSAGLLIARQVERLGRDAQVRIARGARVELALPRWAVGEGEVRGLNWSTRCSSSELMGRWVVMVQGSLRSSDF